MLSLASRGLQLATTGTSQPLTPNCGSCAAGVNDSDPTQFDASLSGFGCALLLPAVNKAI